VGPVNRARSVIGLFRRLDRKIDSHFDSQARWTTAISAKCGGKQESKFSKIYKAMDMRMQHSGFLIRSNAFRPFRLTPIRRKNGGLPVSNFRLVSHFKRQIRRLGRQNGRQGATLKSTRMTCPSASPNCAPSTLCVLRIWLINHLQLEEELFPAFRAVRRSASLPRPALLSDHRELRAKASGNQGRRARAGGQFLRFARAPYTDRGASMFVLAQNRMKPAEMAELRRRIRPRLG
jgi:hypothetical protein